MKALSGFYYVESDGALVTCKARGLFRKQGITPVVGDLVRLSMENGEGTVQELLPRKNAFIRPAIANIDVLVVLASCAVPVTEPFLIDRVFAIAAMQNVPVILCVNKDDEVSAEPLARIYEHAGFQVIRTSAKTHEGVAALRAAIDGRFSAFTGNSGVGKSSLLNCMSPQLALPVSEVSEKLGRGRHTTRHIELYRLGESTFVADTPGFSSFDTERMELVHKEQLQYAFQDFAPFLGGCQFHDCAHRKEPGCCVRAALSRGELEPTRYESYTRLYEMAMQIKDWEHKQ